MELDGGRQLPDGHPPVSSPHGHHPLRLRRQEERSGPAVRVHRLATHRQGDGLAQGEALGGHLLPEAQAQQPAQAAEVRLPGPRHPTPHHPQQQPGRHRGVVAQLHR